MRIQPTKPVKFEIPGDADKAWIEIRLLTPGEVEDINDEADPFDTIFRMTDDGAMVPEMRAKPVKGKTRYLALCKSVVGWGGVNDEDGAPLPCTDENKIRLARDVPGFADFVVTCRNKLAEDAAKAREAAEKNS